VRPHHGSGPRIRYQADAQQRIPNARHPVADRPAPE
jgi:hypothetical protein